MNNKKAQERQKRAKIIVPPVEKQLELIFSYPCIFIWSDGHQSATTLGRAFDSNDSYKRYAGYKQNNKPYPIKIEAVAPAEPTKVGSIFPNSTIQKEFETIAELCERFTEGLGRFNLMDAEELKNFLGG